MNTKELSRSLRRPITAVRQRAYELGLTLEKYAGPWSEDEIEKLKNLFPVKTKTEIAGQLGRSKSGVASKIAKLGLKKGNYCFWSKPEVELLRELYSVKTCKEISEQIGKPVASVAQKIYRLGLRKKTQNSWSEKEIYLLRLLYPVVKTRNCL